MVEAGLAARGLELRRHPAARRQAMLERHDIDLVLDVGAAAGGYAQLLRAFGYAGRIISFEPLPTAWAGLSRAVARDPHWSAHQVALGEENGTASMNVASNSDSSSLLPMGEAHLRAAPDVTYRATQEVVVRRLDEMAQPHLAGYGRPFLKLDTQGFERQVLAGGPETLARCRGLQLELSFVPLYDGGMLANEAISLAYDHGFHLVGFEQGFADPGGQMLQADGVFFRDD